MNRLIASAADAGQPARHAGAPFPDDNVFLIVRARGARLMDERASWRPRHRGPAQASQERRPCGHRDRRASAAGRRGWTRRRTRPFDGGTRLLTLRSFLTPNAIRSTNAMNGVDWCSSNNSTPCALGQIAVPLLVAAMGGNTAFATTRCSTRWPRARTRTSSWSRGPPTIFEPCTECETRKDQYGNAQRNFFNYVVRWMNGKF